MERGWEVWMDRGGTFTDVMVVGPAGQCWIRKVPTLPGDVQDPGLEVAFSILAQQNIPLNALSSVQVGTTIATNALLERKGSRLLLVTPVGFGDGLRIGHQARPDLFALQIRRPDPLFAEVLEVPARVSVTGEMLETFGEAEVLERLRDARQRGMDAVAIVLLHAWKYPEQEQQIARLAQQAGFEIIVTSHACNPLQRWIQRGESTVFEAYLEASLRAYVLRLTEQLCLRVPHARLEFMQSSGGLTTGAHFGALKSVLSGPAGGLMGMARIGADAGFERLIGFDMGGTSTDVSLYEGRFLRRFEQEVEGYRISTPMLEVHTIAAGGGSILSNRSGRYMVGPASAGAFPGPACYGRGGPATLTDVQVVLGHLSPDAMPCVFGRAGTEPLSVKAAYQAVAELDPDRPIQTVAEDFLAVAVEAMANAIRHVSVRQGIDPADFVMVAFGGAAGQHACRVAMACGISRVLLHPLASVLSAYGIGTADRLSVRREGVEVPLTAAESPQIQNRIAALREEATRELEAAGILRSEIMVQTFFEIRPGTATHCLDISYTNGSDLSQSFMTEHHKRFGYRVEPSSLHLSAIRAEAHSLRSPPLLTKNAASDTLIGPALLVEPHTTLVLEAGWSARRLPNGALLSESLLRSPTRPTTTLTMNAALAEARDPAQIAIYDGLFMHIATQMGDVLRRTAQSVNIKERLDFSCAIFDGAGSLVANAPHVPVHLGSMGATVESLLERHKKALRPHDAWLLNAPACGGTHLPDLTVVTPIFLDSENPAFFIATRAHHADIGGISPGSMPPTSRHLAEEGAIFEGMPILRDGVFLETEVIAAFMSGPAPARNPQQNLADLRAQLAAATCGENLLRRAVVERGRMRVEAAMQAVQENAERCVREALRALGPKNVRHRASLDGGQQICVHVIVGDGTARIDFSGTSAAGAHNFNAPRAVTRAAVLYVLRTLVSQPIPLNAGCLRPIDLIIPPGSLLDPPKDAAVVAGNVETSQVVVDALYAALGVLAASQGTMNNLTFGNEILQYYETIAGGSGAGEGFVGCDAVQVHMTNSRLTDPEILESRYPVRVRRFEIRQGSGGSGRWRGGNGARKILEFLEPMRGAMLANRRRISPPGLNGGGDGAVGATRIHRRDGRVEELDSSAVFSLEKGDMLEVETPGGGGFGGPTG